MASRSHHDAVARRLELLSAELDTWREPAPDSHTHVRGGVGPQPAPPPGPVVEPAAAPAPVTVPVPGRHAARRTRPGVPGLSILHGRVRLGPGQLAVAAVLVAVGLAITAWWVVRDAPAATVGAPLVGSGGGALVTPVPASTGPSAAAPSADVVVDVAGKVRRPGIVVLDPGARVVDALEAAGGARPRADLTGLNLARPLVDGEQVLVGLPLPPGPAASAAASPGGEPPGALVNLNTASGTELEELPGVGPVTSQAIQDFRAEGGGFTSVEQLLDVDGIGEATLADLAPLVTVG